MPQKVVLLVEDNASDEELTIRALKNSGIPHSIQVARDGQEAIDCVLASAPGHLPDLVLLDLKLPKISGLDVLARLRANARTRSIPVVVLTSSSKPEDIEAAYRLGCNGYVSKGVDHQRFVQLAKGLLQYWLVHNLQPQEH